MDLQILIARKAFPTVGKVAEIVFVVMELTPVFVECQFASETQTTRTALEHRVGGMAVLVDRELLFGVCHECT